MYIALDDFVGAKIRFDQANSYWQPHWFDVCWTIAQRNPFYLKTYMFNKEECTIIKVQVVVKYSDFAPSHTYLVDLMDENNERVFTKVGKANNVDIRLNQILRKGYNEADIEDINIQKVYGLPSEDLAEAFESIIKHYIKTTKDVGYYPRDRFTPFSFTEEDYAKLDTIQNILIKLFE